MVGEIIGNFISKLLAIAILGGISVICWISFGVYKIYTPTNEYVIESNNKITPTTKLHTDGKTIDTIYVYTFKK